METRTSFLFAPFRLDVSSEQLWREGEAIPLRPKTFAVLRYLVEQAGKLVTKDELLDIVWAGTVVSDTVLKSCIRELREALGDDVQSPQYIATMHRRGYRWVASLSTAPLSNRKSQGESQKSSPAPSTQHLAPLLIGRESELAHLHSWLDKALRGERQLVFVTGEPGIGKTTLIDVFLQQIASQELWLGRGQCVEQYGAGEPYMPILEALGRLCSEPGGDRLIALLHQHAPTWLVQMPTLLETAELETLQRKVQGATRERMLREMAEAVDAIAAEQPLVLWLEDLHWSDPSTLELLALLARRREPARLLVIGTYRPVDVIVSEHPLRMVKQELQLHGQCQELSLRLLTEDAVVEYLAVKMDTAGEAHHPVSLQPVARAIHQRTEGNPLFMVNVVEELLAQETINRAMVERNTPATIRQMIEQRLERLSAEDQRVLEVASVAGIEFSAAAVAAGAEVTVDEIEVCCAGLARRGQFLQARGAAEWPDGTVATRYGFFHALYQDVAYERIPIGQRVNLHQRIGEREESAYGTHAGEIATELAVHFEQGRDFHKTITYLQRAGENAMQRSAHIEAIRHLTKGLEVLKALPDTAERAQRELTLQVALGTSFALTKGYGSEEVKTIYMRARELCQQVGDMPQVFLVLLGLRRFYAAQAQFQIVRELENELQVRAQSLHDSELLSYTHGIRSQTLVLLGECVQAKNYAEQGLALYDPRQQLLQLFRYGNDARIMCLCHAAVALWYLGYPDQACKRGQEALAWGKELSHAFSLASALDIATQLAVLRRETQAVQEGAEAEMALSRAHGFAGREAFCNIYHGWVLAQQGQWEEGRAQIQTGLTAWQAAGAKSFLPFFLAWLAEVYGEGGHTEDGLREVAKALTVVGTTEERFYEAELYRLKGELTLQQSNASSRQVTGKSKASRSKSAVTNSQPPTPNPQKEAEACFFNAIEIARRQSAKSWELRASTSLARLWQQQGKQKEAHKLLTEIYGWFTEGFDTKDLQEAKALLGELG